MAAFDLVVAGAGIVGLAHALAATRRGLRVAIVERDASPRRSSVQNFGFITITGQAEGETRARALRSREVWLEVASAAGIPIEQRGALIVARRPEALAVLEEYAATSGGEGCEMLDADALRQRLPAASPRLVGALASPLEIRVEARDAVPALLRWLEEGRGVTVYRGRTALGLEAKGLATDAGLVEAGTIVVGPGSDFGAFSAELAARHNLRQCMLHMMRVRASVGRLPAVLMGDLSLLRYEGFAQRAGAQPLRERLEAEQGAYLAAGVHVIVAQGADGSLVVGDSHHYAARAEERAGVLDEQLILEEFQALLQAQGAGVVDRWTGVYPVADVKPLLVDAPAPRARVIAVTNGLGMSTAFAIGEETVAELFA